MSVDQQAATLRMFELFAAAFAVVVWIGLARKYKLWSQVILVGLLVVNGTGWHVGRAILNPGGYITAEELNLWLIAFRLQAYITVASLGLMLAGKLSRWKIT